MEYLNFLIVYLLVINAAGFLLMLIDKNKARNHRHRISEMTLLMVAGAGGSVGSLAGMYIFHHKTRKKKFTLGVPTMLALHIYIIFYMCYQLI